MERKTWITTDKTSWGPGPWQDEPDKEQFADEATGLPCLIKRSSLGGNLCGYVGVSEGHPWFGKGYGDLDETVEVHGGLTYSGFCQEGDEAQTICHVPGPGEPDRVYWLGFDCGHAWDIMPAMDARHREFFHDADDHYRAVAYVKAECAALAKQASEAALAAVLSVGQKAESAISTTVIYRQGFPTRRPAAGDYRPGMAGV